MLRISKPSIFFFFSSKRNICASSNQSSFTFSSPPVLGSSSTASFFHPNIAFSPPPTASSAPQSTQSTQSPFTFSPPAGLALPSPPSSFHPSINGFTDAPSLTTSQSQPPLERRTAEIPLPRKPYASKAAKNASRKAHLKKLCCGQSSSLTPSTLSFSSPPNPLEPTIHFLKEAPPSKKVVAKHSAQADHESSMSRDSHIITPLQQLLDQSIDNSKVLRDMKCVAAFSLAFGGYVREQMFAHGCCVHTHSQVTARCAHGRILIHL